MNCSDKTIDLFKVIDLMKFHLYSQPDISTCRHTVCIILEPLFYLNHYIKGESGG